MPKIRPLSQQVISKTAAGEVVERPASVVKELLDNSLDAGAKNIKIEIEENGLNKIRIIDDGEGMEKEDVLECLKPHTTSKIFTEDDLVGIKSLGFRGEAINSIASVSQLSIKSKTPQYPTGNCVEAEGGEITNKASCGMPDGTIVEVSNLFYNTPARKKFLKSPQTEFRNILEVVVGVALANPQTGFKLSHNGKVKVDVPPAQTLEERLKEIFGQNISTELIKINSENSYYKISGFISKPQFSSPNLNNQYLFVNGRVVKNRLISNTIKEAYKNLLEPRVHPSFIVFLNLPYDLVDVNIHPRKEEVAFYNEKGLKDFIGTAVSESLSQEDLTYSTDILGNFFKGKGADYYSFTKLKDSVEIWDARETNSVEEPEVIQIHNCYLITQTSDGFALIDQHAAHERILYEQFLEEFMKKRVEPYTLEKPLLISLSLIQVQTLNEHQDLIRDLGFEVEDFGNNQYKIVSIPEILKMQPIEEIIKEILEDISNGNTPKKLNEKSNKTISYLACRSAIKSGDYLNPEERKKLLKKLAETKTNYTCPHGRPVKVEVPIRKLEKTFKRI